LPSQVSNFSPFIRLMAPGRWEILYSSEGRPSIMTVPGSGLKFLFNTSTFCRLFFIIRRSLLIKCHIIREIFGNKWLVFQQNFYKILFRHFLKGIIAHFLLTYCAAVGITKGLSTEGSGAMGRIDRYIVIQ